jgi:phosphatidylserine/phosphatidylglycerophosphate/cardiolipin synthase-like enzyme
VRIKDFADVDNYQMTLVDKNTTPRMPWRDIAICLRGPVTKDVTRHFIQYWNFAKSDLEGNNRRNFLMKKNFNDKDKTKKAATGTKVHVKGWQFQNEDQLEPGEYEALRNSAGKTPIPPIENMDLKKDDYDMIKETLSKREQKRRELAQMKVNFEIK